MNTKKTIALKIILIFIAVIIIVGSNSAFAQTTLWSTGSGNDIYYEAGNVGIGTTTPATNLQVVDDAAPNHGSSFIFTNPRRGLSVNGTATDDTHPFMYSLNVTATRSSGTAPIAGLDSTIAITHSSTQSGVAGGSASNYTLQIGAATGSGTVDITDVRGFSYDLNRRYDIPSSLTYNITDSYGARFDIRDGGSNYGGPVNISNHYGIYMADYIDSGGRKVDIANFTGIWIEGLQGGDMNNYGIVLDGDGAGADIVLGDNQESRIYGNSGNIIFNTSGNVGIGTTDPQGYKLYVNGTAYFTGINQTSDIQLKKNITPINDALSKVMNLKGVSYKWNTTDYGDRGFEEGKHYGVIAQDVEKVLPEIVKENGDGYKGVAYTEMIPVLIEAVKEQQKTIEKLEAKIKQMEMRDITAMTRLQSY